MSDTPQGPDWWQASDDKWYPPPRPDMPGVADTTVAAPVMAGPGAPPMGPPLGPPTGPPTGPPSGGYAPPGVPSGGFPPGGPPSPYGGMPAGPPPGTQNRTPLFIAIGVVVAIALVALVVVLTNSDDDEPSSSPTSTPTDQPEQTAGPGTTTASPETTAAAPAGDAAVAVVESGFSNFMGGFDQDQRSVAYGFIVENSGDDVATDITISVSAYDAAGTAVASDSHTIHVLRPGEKMGLGDEFFGDTFAGDVDRIDVQVSEPSGLGSEEVPAEGTLTAEGITTTADDYSVTTKFTAKSTYGEQLDYPSAYAIYRNAEGTIIGGSTGTVDFIPANGSVAAEVRSWEAIPNIETTEIYLDPGWFD
ncbi:MAG TPA: hypothetical protein VFH36_02325 [Acidimicrobiales bacterium]|nr:hypothetical protein [Acidimicrobiales bacterium]